MTAFLVAAEREACQVGCHLQAATAAGTPPRPSVPRNPLAYFQQVMFSLAGHVGRLVRVSWAWTSSQPRPQPLSQPHHLQLPHLTHHAHPHKDAHQLTQGECYMLYVTSVQIKGHFLWVI